MVEEAVWYVDFEGRVSDKLDPPPPRLRLRVTPEGLWRLGLLVAVLWLAWETRSVARATEANGRIQAAVAADGDGE